MPYVRFRFALCPLALALLSLNAHAAETAALQLGATNISAEGLGATTEDTHAYTTGSMSSATGLPLSIRETPQSVTVITLSLIHI